jgi:hypothetical protein
MRGQSKLKCFSLARHFQESLVVVNKAVLALLVNIRLCLQGTNSLAYFAATSVTKKKYFKTDIGPGQSIEFCTIVIYKCSK